MSSNNILPYIAGANSAANRQTGVRCPRCDRPVARVETTEPGIAEYHPCGHRAAADGGLREPARRAPQLADSPVADCGPGASAVTLALHVWGPLRQAEIADIAGLPQRTVRRALRSLREADVVERVADAQDARRCRYRVVDEPEVRTDGGDERTLLACPECDTTQIDRRSERNAQRRGRDAGAFRCRRCEATFDEPCRRTPHDDRGGLKGLASELDQADSDDLVTDGGTATDPGGPAEDVGEWAGHRYVANAEQTVVAVEGAGLHAVVAVDHDVPDRSIDQDLDSLTAAIAAVQTGRADPPRVDQDGDGR